MTGRPHATPERSPANGKAPNVGANPVSRRGLFLRALIGFGVLSGYLAAVLIGSIRALPDRKLTGFDRLATPGESVELVAKIEIDGPGFVNPDVAGVEIEFLGPRAAEKPAQGAILHSDPAGLARTASSFPKSGSAISNKDGIARLRVDAPKERGDYHVLARVVNAEGLQLRESVVPLVLSVLEPAERIVITDIDNTIAHTSLPSLLKDKPEESPPLDRAPQALNAIAASHRIIYLTARPAPLTQRTRRWLARHGFPLGAVLLRDLEGEYKQLNFDEGEFKRILIRDTILPRWPNVAWGIGNTENDVYAFALQKLRVIILEADIQKIEAQLRPFVRTAKDWNEVLRIVEGI